MCVAAVAAAVDRKMFYTMAFQRKAEAVTTISYLLGKTLSQTYALATLENLTPAPILQQMNLHRFMLTREPAEKGFIYN